MGKDLVLYWIMWAMTRVPGNPITGGGGPISEMAVAIEVFQIAYIVLAGIIIAKESKREVKTSTKEKIR